MTLATNLRPREVHEFFGGELNKPGNGPITVEVEHIYNVFVTLMSGDDEEYYLCLDAEGARALARSINEAADSFDRMSDEDKEWASNLANTYSDGGQATR